MTEPSTPLMRQYAAIKKDHPSALLFFRLGDFYELFFDDAVLAAKELQITLTSRNKEKGVAIPMCGVPHHAAEGYISKLIRKGFKVAICEQVEDPRLAKKLVRREVTRVVTPGTAADSSLSSEENNFLAAIAQTGERVGFAALDLSTGEFRATEFQGERRRPKEFRKKSSNCARKKSCTPHRRRCSKAPSVATGARAGQTFDAPRATPKPLSTTGSLPPTTPSRCWKIILECCRSKASACPANLPPQPPPARSFTTSAPPSAGRLSHVDRIGFYERQTCLVLDAVTVRNLELIEPLFAGADAGITLFRSIDATVTPMGKRLLRSWLLRPSIDVAEINARLDAVESQVKETIAREELRRALDGILDLERLLSRVTLETANPRDLLALAASLAKLPAVRKSSAARAGASCGRGRLGRERHAIPAQRAARRTSLRGRRTRRSSPAHREHHHPGAPNFSQRRRRHSTGRGPGTRPAPRPEPQQQAIPGADRAARTPAHRHCVA